MSVVSATTRSTIFKCFSYSDCKRAISSHKRVDGQHPQRRHVIQQDPIVMMFSFIQILFEHLFPAHGVDQRYLHA